MDLIPYIVDWTKAQVFRENGTFEDEFEKARDRKRSWAQEVDDFPTFDAYYFTVARAFQALRSALTPAARKPAEEFFQSIIAENGVCQDFGDEALFRCDQEPGRFLHSISPESATKLAALGHQLDWAALKTAYSRKVKRDDQKVLSELSMHEDVSDGFEGCFRPYTELWIELLDRASTKKRGIITEGEM